MRSPCSLRFSSRLRLITKQVKAVSAGGYHSVVLRQDGVAQALEIYILKSRS